MFSGHVMHTPPDADSGDVVQQHEAGAGAQAPSAAQHGVVDHDIAVSVPMDIEGRVLTRTELQTFCRTAQTLEMGMCGGAASDSEGRCAGIVEGVVPDAQPGASRALQEIAGTAVYIEADLLRGFLKEVERELLA